MSPPLDALIMSSVNFRKQKLTFHLLLQKTNFIRVAGLDCLSA